MIYVDDSFQPFGRMRVCHLIADTHEELLAAAAEIGVSRRHIRQPGTPCEHFDVSMAKRRRAVDLGAMEVTADHAVRIYNRKAVEAEGMVGAF